MAAHPRLHAARLETQDGPGAKGEVEKKMPSVKVVFSCTGDGDSAYIYDIPGNFSSRSMPYDETHAAIRVALDAGAATRDTDDSYQIGTYGRFVYRIDSEILRDLMLLA